MTLEVDLPCMGCGYNLRGLAQGGSCPECGVNIARSVERDGVERGRRGAPLSVSDPGWLRRLRDGGVMILIGGTIVLGSTCYQQLAPFGPSRVVMGEVCWLVGLVPLLFGIWRLGTPEPVVNALRSSHIFCAILRVGAIYPLFTLIVIPALRVTTWMVAFCLIGFVTINSLTTLVAFLWIARLLTRTQQIVAARVAIGTGWLLSAAMCAIEIYRLGVWRLSISLQGEPALPVIGYATSIADAFDLYRNSRPPVILFLWAVVTAVSFVGVWVLVVFTEAVGRASEHRHSRAGKQ